MKRLFTLLLIVIALVISSCKGLSPFFADGKTKALLYCGNEGEMVIFIDVAKSRDMLKKHFDIPSSVLSRFRDIIAITSTDGIYGVVEGNIPLIAKKIIIKKLGGSKTEEDGLVYYKANMSDIQVSFDLVYPGVILFSLGNYKKAHENFVSKRSDKISPPLSSYMQDSSVAVYGSRPVNDSVDMFKDSVMKGTLLTMDFDVEHDRVILNGIMQFSSQSAFNAMKVSMKNNMVRFAKEQKISTMELINGMRSTKFLDKEQAMVYDNYNMPLDMLKFIVMKGDADEAGSTI